MKDRIRTIRNANNLNQLEFAEKLGLSRNFISLVETGGREISDRTINDICKIFSISESWLRTGEGEMLNLPEDEDAAIVAEILGNSDNEFYQEILKLVKAFSECDPKEQDAIISLIKRYKKL